MFLIAAHFGFSLWRTARFRPREGEEWGKGAARFVSADEDSVILRGVEESTVVQVEFV